MGKQVKKALLFFDRADEYYLRVESALLEKEFQVLRVSSIEQFFERTRSEIFQVYVIFFNSEAYLRGTLDLARKHFPSKLTPKVLVGPSIEFSSQEHTSMLNQYFLNDTEPSLIAEFCDETSQLFYQDNRHIKISDFDVPRMVAGLSNLRFTGEVDIDHGEEQCSVYFHFGRIVCASSSREDQKFGQLLLQFGIVTPEQVDHVLGIVSSQGKRIGQIFVDLGMITNSKLLEMLELQVKHIVIPTFNWNEGNAEIVFQTANPDEVFPIQIDPAKLIKEGIKLRLSDAELERKISTKNHYVRCVQNKQTVLEDRDALIYAYLQGARQRVESVLISNRFTKTELLRALYYFHLFDLVEFREALQRDDVPIEKKESLERLYHDESSPKPKEAESAKVPEPRKRGSIPWKTLSWVAVFLGGAAGIWMRSQVQRRSTPVLPPARPIAKVNPTPVPTPIPPTARPEPTPVPTQVPQETPIPRPVKKTEPLEETMDMKISRARAEQRAGRWVAAEAICSDVIDADEKNAPCLLILGEAWIEQEKYGPARQAFEKILLTNPKHPRANLHLGTLLIEDGKNIEAMPYLQKFIENANPREDSKLIAETQKVLQSMEAGQ